MSKNKWLTDANGIKWKDPQYISNKLSTDNRNAYCVKCKAYTGIKHIINGKPYIRYKCQRCGRIWG